jgi:hypothetical protein
VIWLERMTTAFSKHCKKGFESVIYSRRRYLLLLVFAFMSCNRNNNEVKPSTSLPTTLCSSSFQYGYTDKPSYYSGDTVKAYLNSAENVSLCRLDINTITGDLAFSLASPLTIQTISSDDPSVKGFGFQFTVAIQIPDDLKSGIYLIENQVPFVVKTKVPVDLVIVYPLNTANAYCTSGGRSLYSTNNKPTSVSFLRPILIQSNSLQCLKWFTTLSSVTVGYIVDGDLEDFTTISLARVLVIPGHSEYWTRNARLHFDQFVNQGGHALVLAGNTMWWQVRYSDDGNQLICYKFAPDPEPDVLLKTINWTDPSLNYSILSSIGADFPHGGYGEMKDNGWDGYKIVTPYSPLLEGTNLAKGDTIKVPTGEYDGTPILGFDQDGYPSPDIDSLNVFKIEMVGFDLGSRGGKQTIGTFVVLQRTATSGVIVNAASYDWCSDNGMGGKDGDVIKKVTYNAIMKLLDKASVFSK